MKKIPIILLMLISINLIGQSLAECGIDNNPKLTQTESEFLNEYMTEAQRKNHDLTDKEVIFITGNSAHQIGTKSEYFNRIKKWNENGNKIATWIVELNDDEKIKSGGYDVIVTYHVKLLTKRRKRIIINEIKASR
ncbi:hypothetical protein [Olleya sp. Bg11-27]|uniref:hypothetical protein n=1 Tax=Olleya sp. Bg11-27 TaxID=2058135 RepID=UPI000C30B83E|nr:hypothetical protein [Olleya sp. Bg11-27]AUC74915.1 hypothetical protein CW732_04175 [Olleya sp. Bg11-27]AUC76671.1 hypothetical protein CW732_13720 [Olleya sp. Bg11-27]